MYILIPGNIVKVRLGGMAWKPDTWKLKPATWDNLVINEITVRAAYL